MSFDIDKLEIKHELIKPNCTLSLFLYPIAFRQKSYLCRLLKSQCLLCLSHCFLISVGFIPTGVECFSDNCRLAAWADILFLCCLPSHLPKVCADLHSNLSKRCLVYSFTSAVPITRYHHIHTHTHTQHCCLLIFSHRIVLTCISDWHSFLDTTSFSNHSMTLSLVMLQMCGSPALIWPRL